MPLVLRTSRVGTFLRMVPTLLFGLSLMNWTNETATRFFSARRTASVFCVIR